MKKENDDPQVTVTGELKQLELGDVIVFTLNLLHFQLVFIVNIPGEGETRAPVYCKFKLRERRYRGPRPIGTGADASDDDDDYEARET